MTTAEPGEVEQEARKIEGGKSLLELWGLSISSKEELITFACQGRINVAGCRKEGIEEKKA